MQKRTRKNLVILCTIIALVCSMFATPAVATTSDDGVNLALDVMFVMDGSASMRTTDPSRIAMAACNLFTDMCDYDQARAGYVVYSDQIRNSYPLTALNHPASRDALKNSINSVYYPQSASTDISLGLTKAMNMLIEGGALASDRSPMMILLSDGKSSDLTDARWAVYDKELKDTLSFLENNNIPVYTIAICNENTDTDEKVMQDIATSTGGLYFSIDNADKISNILSQIMANRLRSSMDNLAEFDSDGTAQTVKIDIPNDSVYQANVIVFSSKGIAINSLKAPGNITVATPSETVLTSRSTSYDLIKLIQPMKGTWELTITGADQDHVIVNLINSYDMQFRLKADQYTIPNGSAVSVGVYCSSLIEGETDSSIFDGAEGTLTIKNTVTGDAQDVDLAWNGTELNASHTFTKAGTYTISGRIIGKDRSYDRITDEIKITVQPYPLTLVQTPGETNTFCFSPFLGICIKNKIELPLTNLFSWDTDATIAVNPTPGGWEDSCDFHYDEATHHVTITAKKAGTAIMDLTVTDSFGQNAAYTIRAKVIAGWVPFAAILALALLIAAVIFLIKKITAPKLGGKLTISVSLPSEISDRTPPQAELDLSILNKKGKVPFNAVLASNLTLSGAYMNALEGIAGFVQKLSLEAADKDCSSLNLYIPAAENGVTVQFNNAPVEKATKKPISGNMPAVLNYASFSASYSITFSFGAGGDWGGTGWGNNGGGGFGGFGGGTNGGGFGGGTNDGGFGGGFGGSSNDGFGGGFGGGSNPGGGFGGNDNGNNGGGFGGFGNSNNNGGGFNAF